VSESGVATTYTPEGERMSLMRRWCWAFGLTVAAVAVSYLLLDRPISFFAHANLASYPVFAALTFIPEPLTSIATVLILVVGVLTLSEHPPARWQRVALTFGFSILSTSLAKNHVKLVFGRTWPETWTQGNPSLIRDNVYGFNFLHAPHGKWYEAFPSGHTAAIGAAATVLWVCYPRLRALWALLAAAVVVGLIGTNFHFLSDIIAGGLLGTTVAAIALRFVGLVPAKPCEETRRRAAEPAAVGVSEPARS